MLFIVNLFTLHVVEVKLFGQFVVVLPTVQKLMRARGREILSVIGNESESYV